MAIKIDIKKTYIPVEIGDLKLKFHYNDESLFVIKDKLTEAQEELLALDETDLEMEEMVKERNKVLKKAYDGLFEEGTFDKIWEMSPSSVAIYSYFNEIVEGLLGELEELGLLTQDGDLVKQYTND